MISETADPLPRTEEGLAPILDAEVRNLPARYREPVILCHLQGQSHAAAAAALGWPIGASPAASLTASYCALASSAAASPPPSPPPGAARSSRHRCRQP